MGCMGPNVMWVACLLVTVMTVAETAQAQAELETTTPLNTETQPNQPTLPQNRAAFLAFVSVESSLPWLTGNDLRRAIRNQTGFEVLSPAEARALQPGTPAMDAPVMLITISRRGEVTVVCGDAPEGVQWVRVNAPIRSVMDATATLAAAVLSAAHNHQEQLAELQRRNLERAALIPQPDLFPTAALEVPGNPYHQTTCCGQPLPYLLPNNPYYVSRRNSGST
jgi:hypothetical protein